MKTRQALQITFVVILSTLLIAQSSQAQDFEGFGGFISTDVITPGQDVVFTGSIKQYEFGTITVTSMNVAFVERLGGAAIRSPREFNFTKSYGDRDVTVAQNVTFTDSMVETIDLDTGVYNVSIFFIFTNGTSDANRVYSLINQSVVMEGSSSQVRAIEIGAIIIGVVTIGVIGLLVYYSVKK